MSSALTNMVVVILSTEKWGVMKNSKHNYAMELVRSNNKVFFVNPPDKSLPQWVNLSRIDENLIVVDYRPVYRGEKYLPGWIFNFLVWLQVFIIKRKIRSEIDIVWSFDPVRFPNLRWFTRKTRLFHAVDHTPYNKLIQPALSADIILAVSESILSKYASYPTPAFFINHGLNKCFINPAISNLRQGSSQSKAIKIGYIGNLFIEALDHDIFRKIIQAHNELEFHFWGPYEMEKSNLLGHRSESALAFSDFLQQAPNVTLYGSCSPEEVASGAQFMDAFVLFYKANNRLWDNSNSHKILEYLSTGQVIIASHFSTYAQNTDLLVMAEEQNNEGLPQLFSDTIRDLTIHNSEELKLKRKRYASNNIYSEQIERIGDRLRSLDKIRGNRKVQTANLYE